MKIKFLYLSILIISIITLTSCANINTISPVKSSLQSSSCISMETSNSFLSSRQDSFSSSCQVMSQHENSSSPAQPAESNISRVTSSKKPISSISSYTSTMSKQPNSNSSSKLPTVSKITKTGWPPGGTVPSPVDIPNLDGTTVSGNSRAIIDLSYTSYGFIKINLTAPSKKRIKVIIGHKSFQYTYDLKNDGSSEVYPLQMGDGDYTVSVYENISNSQYAQIFSTTAQVSLSESYTPFLVPSQFVNYSSSSNAAAAARQLVNGKTNNYDRISAVLTYIASNISYDYTEAENVKSGYIPNVDQVLARKKGICFDYAAVSAAMLRSLGYPTKLIEGFAAPNNVYHAWNEVYIQGQGWIKVMSVTVNTKNWTRVDVTFISNSKSPSSIEKYIGNSSNYTTQYVY